MGIKYIHVTLIIISILLCLGFGIWAVMHPGYSVYGCASFAISLGLLAYCVEFIKKMKVL